MIHGSGTGIPTVKAGGLYKKKKRLLDLDGILNNMTVIPKRADVGRAIGKAVLGKKHARPKCPGAPEKQNNCGAEEYASVAAPVYADEITGAMPDRRLWSGSEAALFSRPLRTLQKTCEAGGFAPPPARGEFETLTTRGFESMNMLRDDHTVVAYFYLVYLRVGRALPFEKLRAFVILYKDSAEALVPHTLSPGSINALLRDIVGACGTKTAPASANSLEDQAEAVCRRQPFAKDECGPLVIQDSRAFAAKLKAAVPDTFSVLPRTLARIAVTLAVSRQGLKGKVMNPADRPYISKKMRQTVKRVSAAGLS